MIEFTQEDVADLRGLIATPAWKKLAAKVNDRIERLRIHQMELAGNITLDDHVVRMTQLAVGGEIKGLKYFVEKPGNLLKLLVSGVAPSPQPKPEDDKIAKRREKINAIQEQSTVA